jgi:glycogen operon protein
LNWHEYDHNPDPAHPFAINLVVDHAFDWEGVRPPRQASTSALWRRFPICARR